MKLMIGLPWYAGSDPDCEPLYQCFMNYLGALRERSLWRDRLGKEGYEEAMEFMPPLDELTNKPLAEPTEEDWDRLGVVELAVCNMTRTSLVGKARELICEASIQWGADYLLMWDADIRFEFDALLRLWRHQKPVVAALAFTARHPIHPVIYTVKEFDGGYESSLPVLQYPKDKLIGNEDVGGELAFGAGMVLIDTVVFKQVPQPWFSSTGCGEDWFFCHRLSEFNVSRHMDTSVKTQHKLHAAAYADEEAYWRYRAEMPDAYKHQFGELVA